MIELHNNVLSEVTLTSHVSTSEQIENFVSHNLNELNTRYIPISGCSNIGSVNISSHVTASNANTINNLPGAIAYGKGSVAIGSEFVKSLDNMVKYVSVNDLNQGTIEFDSTVEYVLSTNGFVISQPIDKLDVNTGDIIHFSSTNGNIWRKYIKDIDETVFSIQDANVDYINELEDIDDNFYKLYRLTDSGIINSYLYALSGMTITQNDDNKWMLLRARAISYGDGSLAQGTGIAYAENSFAQGGARAQCYQSFAHGGTTCFAFGKYSHAEGNSKAYGIVSHSEGYGETKAIGFGSHAEGADCIANGQASHAEGLKSVSNGYCSHTEGASCSADGSWSHAEGFETATVSACSHAEGWRTRAIGRGSLANGYHTSAYGEFSHAEGCQTAAIGQFSHSEGLSTNVFGINSHADGRNIELCAHYSYAWSGQNNPYYVEPDKIGSFSIDPINGISGFYIGEESLDSILQKNANDITSTMTQNDYSSNITEGVYEDDDSITIVDGFWVRGQFVKDTIDAARSDSARSDLIELKRGDKYKVSGYSQGSAAIYAIYDSDSNGIYAMTAGSAKDTIYVYGYEIDCSEILEKYPSAKYIIFSSYALSKVPLKIKKLKKFSPNDFVTNQLGFADICNIDTFNCYIIKENGGNSTPYDAIATSFIKIDASSRFKVSLSYQLNSCGCACYDKSCKFIGSLFRNDDGSAQIYVIDEDISGEYILSKFPDTAYIRFSSLNCTTFIPKFKMLQPMNLQQIAQKQNDILQHLNMSNPLYGKTWLACGDSFTNMAFGDYIDSNGNKGISSDAYDKSYRLYKTYPALIAKNNDMKLFNVASGGLSITEFANRVSSLSTEIQTSDYLTLMFGLNSSGVGIGVSSDNGLTSEWGIWNNILSVVLSCNPAIKIGLISPDGWLSERNQALHHNVGKIWGIPVLDLKDENVPFQTGDRPYEMNPYAVQQRNLAFQINATSRHPNIDGQKYRSTIIESFMKQL